MKEFETILPLFRTIAGDARREDLRDDVAVLGNDLRHIVTVDALMEGVHFLATDPVETVARKLVRVNISDILAKGAHPAEALLTLGWPDGRSQDELESFAAAFGQELAAWNVDLIGGDTVSSPLGLFLSLTLTGRCIGPGPVRRSGGMVGDSLWVTGQIGAAWLGLQAAMAGDFQSIHLSHYRAPHLPHKAVATVIAEHANAAMDVSDGLLGDAWTLARASGCGLQLDLAEVPFAEANASRTARLAMATGGEDYQCLFALSSEQRAAATAASEAAGLRITCIGHLLGSLEFQLLDGDESLALPARLSFEHGQS